MTLYPPSSPHEVRQIARVFEQLITASQSLLRATGGEEGEMIPVWQTFADAVNEVRAALEAVPPLPDFDFAAGAAAAAEYDRLVYADFAEGRVLTPENRRAYIAMAIRTYLAVGSA